MIALPPPLFDLTYARFDVMGRVHRDPAGRCFSTHATFDDAFEAYKIVLTTEFPNGGVVQVVERTMDAYTHEQIGPPRVRHEGRR